MAVGFDELGNPEDLTIPPVCVAMLAGPSLAGMLLTGSVYKRAGLRELLSGLVRWRVSARWYMKVNALLADILARLFVGFFEETGRTGFVVPEIWRRYSVLFTGVVRGCLVWVYDRTASLWAGMITHMNLVAIQLILVPPLTEAASLTYILVWAAVLWGIVTAVIVVQRRQIEEHRIAHTG